MRKKIRVEWTADYYGVRHVYGLPRRWQITMCGCGGKVVEAYLLDGESDTPFSKHAKNARGSLKYCKSQANKWARELLGA